MFNFFRKKSSASPGSNFSGPEKVIRVPQTGGVVETPNAGLKLGEVAAVLAPAESVIRAPVRPSDLLEWREHLQDDGNHFWQVFANRVYVAFIMFSVEKDQFKWVAHFPEKGSGWTKDINQARRTIRRRWNDFCVSAGLQPIDTSTISPEK